MAMSHADCDHPRTPAGRAACRRGNPDLPRVGLSNELDRLAGKPRRIVATHHPLCKQPEGHNTPGCPVPTGTPAVVTTPAKRRRSAASGQLKRPGTHIRTIGDLPDVPRMLAHGCRIAWQHGWDVVVGHDFNDAEKRIVITGDVAEVALVWRPSLPHGVWGVFVRKHKTSITHRVEEGVEHAMRIAAGSEPFPG